MIITISGTPGSGKSTVARLLAKKLKYRHYSMGDFQRQLAEKKGLTLLELGKLEEKGPSLDQEVDQLQKKAGETEDNFVIDSRLGFYFIPHSIKVYLTASPKIRAQRIFFEKRKKEQNTTLATTLKRMKLRESSEKKRYHKYYHLNPNQKKHYDLLIDATELSPEKVQDTIFHFLQKEKRANKTYKAQVKVS